MTNKPPFWTDEKINLIVRLWNHDASSFTTVGKDSGISRDAVTKKLRKLWTDPETKHLLTKDPISISQAGNQKRSIPLKRASGSTKPNPKAPTPQKPRRSQVDDIDRTEPQGAFKSIGKFLANRPWSSMLRPEFIALHKKKVVDDE